MAPDDRPGSPPYELVYWPGFPGRGELIRLLFEEAGVRYLDTAVSAPDPVAVVGETLAAAGPGPAADHAPPLAPPVLRHGSLLLSQTAAILLYLGPRLGLAPAQGPGPVQLQAIVLTLLDGFVDELHDTHHPVSVSLAYEDQKPEAARKSAVYRSERLPKYLAYLERLLDAAKDRRSGPWLYGDSLTYADLVLFQCIDGALYAFPRAMAALRASGHYEAVFSLYEAVKQRPNIKRYLASPRRVPYGMGIWRHYDELDAPE